MTARATSTRVQVVQIVTPIFVDANEENFRSTVQRLTGLKRGRHSSKLNDEKERIEEGNAKRKRINLEALNSPLEMQNHERSFTETNRPTDAMRVLSPEKQAEWSKQNAEPPACNQFASVFEQEVGHSLSLWESLKLPAMIDIDFTHQFEEYNPDPQSATIENSDPSQVLWDWKEIFATNT